MILRHPLNTAVAAELTGYLKAARMTQAQLARETGISQVVLQRYLAGDRDIQVAHIAKCAAVLGFQPYDLMFRAVNRVAEESK